MSDCGQIRVIDDGTLDEMTTTKVSDKILDVVGSIVLSIFDSKDDDIGSEYE